MRPSAAKAIPPASPGISLPVTTDAIAESYVPVQASTAEGFAR